MNFPTISLTEILLFISNDFQLCVCFYISHDLYVDRRVDQLIVFGKIYLLFENGKR